MTGCLVRRGTICQGDFYNQQFFVRWGWGLSDENGLYWQRLGTLGNPPPNPVYYVNPASALDRSGPEGSSFYSVFSSVQFFPLDPQGYPGQIKLFFTDFQDERIGNVSTQTIWQHNPKIAIDNNMGSNYEGRVYVTWWDTWGWLIKFRYSTDRGSTWGPEITLAEAGMSHP
jgi:hypothetical protein